MKTIPTSTNRMIGSWLYERRIEHGLALMDVASALHIRVERWQQFEQGHLSITIQAFSRFFMLLGRQTIDFFGIPLNRTFQQTPQSFLVLGAQVLRWRIEAGYSLRSLAILVETSHSSLLNLERGAERVQVGTLVQLDRVLLRDGVLFTNYFETALRKAAALHQNIIQIQVGQSCFAVPAHQPDLTSRAAFWQGKLAPVLWCVAVNGRATLQDIAFLMGCEPTALASAMLRLESSHLLESFQTHLLGPIKVYRLSVTGKLFCEELGWSVVESELDRLFSGHQGLEQLRHTAAVLYAAHVARLLGYKVQVLPEPSELPSPFQADLLLSDGVDAFFLEVEEKPRGKTRKWKNQVEFQGFVACCFFGVSAFAKVKAEVLASGAKKMLMIDLREKTMFCIPVLEFEVDPPDGSGGIC